MALGDPARAVVDQPHQAPGVGVPPPQASPATRDLLERIAAGPTGARLRAELASRHRDLDRDEVEDAFQEALKRALVACRAEREYQVYSFLRVTMRNCLSDDRYRGGRERSEDTHGPTLSAAIDDGLSPEAQLARSEDLQELDELRSSVTARLGERQRRVLAMRVEGLDVSAIAEREVASTRAIRKDIERILAVGREEILRRAGFGCPAGHELVARYAFRLRADWAAAQLHMTGCERCGRFFASLDSWRERAATLLPFPAAGSTDPSLVAHTLDRAADGLGHLRDQMTGSAGSARQHMSDAASSVKQHTAGALSRMDPTPLAGARPGAVTAAVVGCLAIGGGAATYCVENGINPIGGLAAIVQEEPPPRTPNEGTEPPEALPEHLPIALPVVVDTPPPTATTPPEQPEQTEQSPPPPEPTPAAVQFGEPATPPAAAPASSEPTTPSPSKPAPVPAEGGTDLYGP
jgi:DNA-directed RNA polymerase specialized sigma24 family protein